MVLLHFENIDLENPDYKKRQKYYDRLTDIFRSLPNPNADLVKVLRFGGYSYKSNLKSENNFRNIVRAEIVKNTHKAIERAKELELVYISLGLPDHQKSPFTLVYKLVEELIKYGEKEIEE